MARQEHPERTPPAIGTPGPGYDRSLPLLLRRGLGPDLDPGRDPGLARLPDPAISLITVVAGLITSTPARSTVTSRTPSLRNTGPATLASSAARSPFSARTIPPGRTRASAGAARRSRGAAAPRLPTSAG